MRNILYLFCFLLIVSCEGENSESAILSEQIVTEEIETIEESESPTLDVKYNINLEGYIIVEEKVKSGQNLSEILYPKGIDYQQIQEVVDLSKDVFSARKIQAGKPYTLILKDDSAHTLDYMIYEIDPIQYVVYDFRDSIRVYRGEKPVTIIEKTSSGIIESSLWKSMVDNDLDQELIMSLSDVYAWTIDFYHLQKGDSFKVIYTQRQVEGVNVGVEQILASEFTHHGTPISAYLFEVNDIPDYFDDDGKSLRKAFLRAPVKFSRISSRYSGKRFHPVQKRYKAHLGTDYAAPNGTPIMATGDGVVVASTYKKFNGNFVKVKHNATYTTQYLHMSKRAVKVGERVLQGQTIGYVGSTGLASGPHVCYRFWKNGKQVDPYRQKLPESIPIQAEDQEEFDKVKNEYSPRLKGITIGNKESVALATSLD